MSESSSLASLANAEKRGKLAQRLAANRLTGLLTEPIVAILKHFRRTFFTLTGDVSNAVFVADDLAGGRSTDPCPRHAG
jgi:hypothetical protein